MTLEAYIETLTCTSFIVEQLYTHAAAQTHKHTTVYTSLAHAHRGKQLCNALNCLFRWLMLKGRESEAREVLRKTVSKLGQEGIEAELEDIRQTWNLEKQNIFQELKLLLKWRNLKRYSWPLNKH